jgi:lipocalin
MRTMLSARTPGVRSAVAAASRPHWSSAIANAVACVLVFAALVCAARPASAQFTQQGPKLVGSGAAGAAEQGYSVALSADVTTAIVAGPTDNSNAGAAWLFSQSGGAWTQQGAKLVGTGAVNTPEPAYQGYSVALSADGSTAIVGGPYDNAGAGAAWVFTLGGNVKLVGSGAVNTPEAADQGYSVALSSDGNTAIVGAPYNNASAGAVWIFTRSGGVWTAGGTELPLGTGAVGAAIQGYSVALSGDGNTAIVGGRGDNLDAGAAWVFTRSGGVWTQQGSKLVGSGVSGAGQQGYSVALSADGTTAIVGGPDDNASAGAVWIFTRSGSIWTQQGAKLVGSGAAGAADQGYAVALSGDGNTAIVGGYTDNSDTGAAWVFTRSGGGVWTQLGPKLIGSGAVGTALQGHSVALSADGTTAIVGGPGDNSNTGAVWIFASSPHIAGSLTAFPRSGPAPLIVTFRVNGLPLPMTYTINFGDGTSGALSQGSCFGSGNGVQCSGSASHAYASAGTYYATLVNAKGNTLGAATITAGGNLVRPLRPLPPLRGTSPPLAISTPTPERNSSDR